MSKYSPKAQQTIENTIQEFKEGKLKNGTSGEQVTDRNQAIAIGISSAHEKHQKIPKKGDN